MIRGIGVDIVDNVRIEGIFSRFGDSFARKILSKNEYMEYECSNNKTKYLAKKFASKEALSKSLGTGLYREGLFPRKIEVIHDTQGKPLFRLNAPLTDLMLRKSINRLHISISDTEKISMATVVAEKI